MGSVENVDFRGGLLLRITAEPIFTEQIMGSVYARETAPVWDALHGERFVSLSETDTSFCTVVALGPLAYEHDAGLLCTGSTSGTVLPPGPAAAQPEQPFLRPAQVRVRPAQPPTLPRTPWACPAHSSSPPTPLLHAGHWRVHPQGQIWTP